MRFRFHASDRPGSARQTGPAHFVNEVEPGDVWGADEHGKLARERSEVRMAITASYGQVFRYALRQRVSGERPLEPSQDGFAQCHLHQWHANKGSEGKSPLMAFSLTMDGHLRISTRGSRDAADKVPFDIQYQDDAFSFDKWHLYLVEICFSPWDGSLRIIRDKATIVDATGIPLGYPDDTGPYPKFGVYRTAMQTSLRVETWWRNLRPL